MTTVVRFILERETKGALRYQEVDEKGAVIEEADKYTIGTLYLRKHAFPAPFPQAIVLTVETK